jgi:hypothetical protein
MVVLPSYSSTILARCEVEASGGACVTDWCRFFIELGCSSLPIVKARLGDILNLFLISRGTLSIDFTSAAPKEKLIF